MADTQVKLTSPPYSNAEDCKKYIMKIYEDLTKDCKDELLRTIFDHVVDYDALNACAIRLFSWLANKGLLDEAKELFKPHPEQTTLPEVAVFTFVMAAMIDISSTETMKEAHKVFQQMIASGVNPTTYNYTLLIAGCTKDFSDSNSVVYAKKYFLEMLDRGMKPLDQIYLQVAGAITYQEPAEEVKKFLHQVEAKGFIPAADSLQYNEDHVTTEALQAIKTYMNLVCSKTTDKAVKKFFCKSVQSGWFMWGIEMQMALVDGGNVDEAIELSHTIQQTEFVPLVQVYTSLIEANLKFGKTQGAVDAYLEMLSAGVAPNSYTYTILIKGLSADPEFFGDAKKYLLEMMDKGKLPNAATYTAVIEGFARREDEAAENEGKDFVEVMMGKGFVPNAKAMREALKGKSIPVIRRIMNIVLSKLKD